MCGIAGWLGDLPDGRKHVAALTQALHHRGPDGQGNRTWPEAGLIHTRLSIIDLSPAGAQPMANDNGTVWTVFNGEIYNHRELRRELEDRGHVFKGQSDTEVLPHLYCEEGPNFVRKLRGMFALAIYDSRTATLLLARDRFGIKPLFYSVLPRRIMFASEIGALRLFPDIDDRPDSQAISDFAALCFIPAPGTFYKGIRALQPGELLEARLVQGSVRYSTYAYHKWTIAPDPTLTPLEGKEKAKELLGPAVRSQLQSDVPLGALLSGGIDSSLVCVAAQNAMKKQLQTFNVRFGEKPYDETWAAVQVAEHINSHHHTLVMDDVLGNWDYVTGLLSHAGQPFADTSLFAVSAVCQLMRRHVTVALSGDGGDEAFGGYGLYSQIPATVFWKTLPRPVAVKFAALSQLLSLSGSISDHIPIRLKSLAGADDVDAMQTLMCWVREDEHRSLVGDHDVLPVRRLFEPQWDYHMPDNATPVERFSALATEVSTRLFLPNDFLFKVDAASMRHGLEVRVPMLDEQLFAFGLTLPHHLKARSGTCKRVLRDVAADWLPSAVATKPKRGFEIPVDSWVDESFKTRFKEILLSRLSPLREFFRLEACRPIIEAFTNGDLIPGVSRQGLYQRAIMLLAVHVALCKS